MQFRKRMKDEKKFPKFKLNLTICEPVQRDNFVCFCSTDYNEETKTNLKLVYPTRNLYFVEGFPILDDELQFIVPVAKYALIKLLT